MERIPIFLRFLGGVLSALLVLPFTAHAAQGQAQPQPRVTARLSSGVLRLGDAGMLSVTVENARDARITELPRVDGLVLEKPGRPMTQQYSSITNGRLYSQTTLTWAISVRPQAEGSYEIPAIAVEVDGQRLTTQPVRLTVVVDLAGEDLGYLEIRPSAARVVEGQPFTVELVFGWDTTRDDVNYAELSLPWWGALPGAIELDAPEIPAGQRVTGIVVNDQEQVTAEQLESRERGGRRYHVLRLARSFLPTRSGTLEFPISSFGFGVRARASIFDRRPPRGESFFVQAPAFQLEVVALPSEGQPLDYSGAVGELAARASADVRDVRVGDSIKLTVEWTGQGNLEFFRAPDPGTLDAFRAFRVYGTTEEKSFERRKVVYDLSPLSTEVQEIPALALSVFDPAESRYEVVESEPIPIRVRPLDKATMLEGEERTFERDIADIDARPVLEGGLVQDGETYDRVFAAALIGVPLLGFFVRARVRKRRGDPAGPLERRRRRARRTLARALRNAGDARAERDAFLEFLAARTREPREAWDGRDLERWARAQGAALSADRCRETAELLARLDAATWAGSERVGSEPVLSAASALEGEGL